MTPDQAADRALNDVPQKAIGESNHILMLIAAGVLKILSSGTVPASISETVDVSGQTTDAGPSWTQSLGISGARYTSADRSASAAAVTDAPASGKKLIITDVLISADTTMRVDLKEETSGTVLASIYMSANTAQQFTFRSPIKLPTADKKLTVQTSVAGNIAVTASYYSV